MQNIDAWTTFLCNHTENHFFVIGYLKSCLYCILCVAAYGCRFIRSKSGDINFQKGPTYFISKLKSKRGDSDDWPQCAPNVLGVAALLMSVIRSTLFDPATSSDCTCTVVILGNTPLAVCSVCSLTCFFFCLLLNEGLVSSSFKKIFDLLKNKNKLNFVYN